MMTKENIIIALKNSRFEVPNFYRKAVSEKISELEMWGHNEDPIIPENYFLGCNGIGRFVTLPPDSQLYWMVFDKKPLSYLLEVLDITFKDIFWTKFHKHYTVFPNYEEAKKAAKLLSKKGIEIVLYASSKILYDNYNNKNLKAGINNIGFTASKTEMEWKDFCELIGLEYKESEADKAIRERSQKNLLHNVELVYQILDKCSEPKFLEANPGVHKIYKDLLESINNYKSELEKLFNS